jgi:hypothetical protein
MIQDVNLIEDEKFIYRYCNIKGIINLHYNIVIVTTLRVIICYAYKPWWYYFVFILNPSEISNSTIFLKYISSIKIKTKPIFSSSFLGPFQFLLSKKINDNDKEHTVLNNNYFTQRNSLDDIIFRALLRGLFLGSVIAAVLLKVYNVHIKIVIAQSIVCIFINILYDIFSYSPVRYLEFYTLDGTGNNENVKYVSGEIKYKKHENYNLYRRNTKNSYIIEGNLNELTYLRDKIITAIKESSIPLNTSLEELKNSKNLENKNLEKENIDNNSTNIKKIKKKYLKYLPPNNSETLNLSKKNKRNPFLRQRNLKKERIENGHESINNIRKRTVIQKFFNFILNFFKLIIFTHLFIVLLLTSMYYITNSLEQIILLSNKI